MSVKIFKFNDEEVETIVVKINSCEWFLAEPLGKALGFDNVLSVLQPIVDDCNLAAFDAIKSYANIDGETILNFNLQPYSVFINDFALYRLALESKTRFAKQFKHWMKIQDRIYEDFIYDNPINYYARARLTKSVLEELDRAVPDENDIGVVDTEMNKIILLTNVLNV